MTRQRPILTLAATALLTGAIGHAPVYTTALAQEGTKNVIPYLDEQPVRARHGMVVSVHHLASDAGVEILRAGGNAVDAAVATGFALAVVHPAAGNLGGGGFLLLRTHDGHATFIDYREKAPARRHRNHVPGRAGQRHPRRQPHSSVIGYRSIATPGSVAGLAYAERKYGKLGLGRVMAPAIKLASGGFVLTAEEAKELTDADLAKFPDSKRIFQRDGNFYKEGETFRQPELARTLERIAADPDDFYHGKMAHELVADLQKGGALLTLEDLAQYNVVERTPITGTFHNYTVISAPPPSSGGIVLAQRAQHPRRLRPCQARRPLARTPSTSSPRPIAAPTWTAPTTSATPTTTPFPPPLSPSKPYAAAWRAGIDPAAATPSRRSSGPPASCRPRPKPPASRKPESHDTTHYSVVDAEGNAVSVTTTLNDSFGSRVTAGSLGFLLNDEMDDFASKIGVPNMLRPHPGPRQRHRPRQAPA